MNSNKIIQQIEAEQLKDNIPEFGAGDTVVVQVKVKEGTRERLQAFEISSASPRPDVHNTKLVHCRRFLQQ